MRRGTQERSTGKERLIWGWTNIIISATLHYAEAWYQIHVSAAKVGLMGFTCSKHLILCRNLLLNVSNFQHAAVDAATRNLALVWGTDYDIRMNRIAPGPIGDTPTRNLALEWGTIGGTPG